MTDSRAREPISNSASSQKGLWIIILFGAVFFFVGLGVILGVFFPKLAEYWSSRDWTRTECFIEESEVRSRQSDDGTKHRAYIKYSYYFNGREYTSDRYSFFNHSSSDYDSKASLVERYPVESSAWCYVNPDDPHQSVMVRELTFEFLFVVIPLFFMVFGAGLVYTAIKKRWGNGKGRPVRELQGMEFRDPLTPGLPAPTVQGSAIHLTPRQSRLGALGFMLFFAIFWNGIVSVFLLEAVSSWRSGNPDYFLTLFILPFVAVGIGVLFVVVKQILALFNPSVTVRLYQNRPTPGETVDIQWEMRGRVRMIRELAVVVEGREVAEYIQGTSAYTDTHVFYSNTISRASHSSVMRMGHASFSIPPDTMHTFVADHNQVMWVLVFKGVIDWRPDLNDEFEIPVYPQ
jgi:hypothetical protein